jgi:putative ABC transport system permease protein
LYAIAFPLASVIAVLFLKNWLKSFIVKVPMEPGLFVLAGVLTLAAGLITVSGQTWKAASANPADLLKTE